SRQWRVSEGIGRGTEGSPPTSRDVAQLLRVGERAELLQALVLDLADALARHLKRAADLVECPRLLAVQAVAQLEHATLAIGQRAQALRERLGAERRVGGLVGERRVLVLDELPELRLLLVADRLLERHRRLRRAANRLDLLDGHLEVLGDLLVRRLAAPLGAQLALRPHDLVQLLDNVDRHADRPRLVRERAGDRLADPPCRVRRELVALAPVELLGGAHEADRPLLDQIEERETLVAVALRDRDDEAQVRLHHLLLRAVVAALDALRELDFLRGGQQIDLADVLEEELQRVRGELGIDGLLDLFGLRGVEVRLGHGVERGTAVLVLVEYRRHCDVVLELVALLQLLRAHTLPPSWMRNHRIDVGRTHRPSGSSFRSAGPT